MSIWKTPAYVQSKKANGSGTSASVTLNAPSTAGNALILSVGWSTTAAVSSVSDDAGNTWRSATARIGTGKPSLQIWYAPNAKSTETVTVTFGASAGSITLVCHEYSGLAPGGSVLAEVSELVVSDKEFGLSVPPAWQASLLLLAAQGKDVLGAIYDAGLEYERQSGDAFWTADQVRSDGEGPTAAFCQWDTTTDVAIQVVVFQAALAGTYLDEVHHYSLRIGGTEYAASVRGAIVVTQPEAGEVGTMRFQLQAQGSALSVTAWQEAVLEIDSRVYFGGYVINRTPAIDQDQPDGWETYDIVVEEYATILDRTPVLRRRYNGSTPGAIVADLFDYALDPAGSPPNQTEFDTTTYVDAGSLPSGATFLVDNEPISEALDRLALLCNFAWWIDGDKKVHFHLAGTTPAPFSIVAVGAANYSTSFPPLSRPTVRRDGSDIRNRVTVYGGVQVLKNDETLTGDGSTLLFQLEHFPVVDMVLITVNGVLQSWGTDWYHSFDDYDVLIDYHCGTIRWDTGNAPAKGHSIVVGYYYGSEIKVTAYNTEIPTSHTVYGRWFDYEIVDRSITNEAMAAALAQAMVNEYEWEAVDGRLQVERLGIKPGEELTVVLPALGLNGNYPVRQVVTEISRAGIARCEIVFGGRRGGLGSQLEGTRQAGPLSRSTRWQDRMLTASLQPIAAKVQGSLMLSVGQTSTDQLAANTGKPGDASTAYQWPVYDKAGNLAGYVPVYGSAW